MIDKCDQSNVVVDALSHMEYQVAQVSKTDISLHQHQIKQMQQQDPTIKEIILQIQASHDAQLNQNFIMIDNVLYMYVRDVHHNCMSP